MKAPIDVREHIKNLEERGLLVLVNARPTRIRRSIRSFVGSFAAGSARKIGRHFFSRT